MPALLKKELDFHFVGHMDEVLARALVKPLDDAYEAKYQMRHGIPFWVLRPRVAFAWSDFPNNATRWRFTEA